MSSLLSADHADKPEKSTAGSFIAVPSADSKIHIPAGPCNSAVLDKSNLGQRYSGARSGKLGDSDADRFGAQEHIRQVFGYRWTFSGDRIVQMSRSPRNAPMPKMFGLADN